MHILKAITIACFSFLLFQSMNIAEAYAASGAVSYSDTWCAVFGAFVFGLFGFMASIKE